MLSLPLAFKSLCERLRVEFRAMLTVARVTPYPNRNSSSKLQHHFMP